MSLLFATAAVFSPRIAEAAEDTNLREEIINLSASESAHDAALVKLKAAKRAELIVIVREMLKQSATENFAVRAASELNLTEVTPDIQALARTSTSTETMQAAKLTQTEIKAKLDSFIGKKKNSALKSVLIGQLGEPLNDDEFQKLIADDDYYVRESVVSQFFATLASDISVKQASRLATLLQLKPMQARAQAMKKYSELGVEKKRALKSAWAQITCANEKEKSIEDLCLREKKEAAQ